MRTSDEKTADELQHQTSGMENISRKDPGCVVFTGSALTVSTFLSRAIYFSIPNRTLSVLEIYTGIRAILTVKCY